MKKKFKFLIYYLINASYFYFILRIASNNDKEVSFNGLKSISQDLYRIGFPNSVTLNYFQVSIFVALFLSIMNIFIYKNYKNNNSLLDYMKYGVLIFIIYIANLFTFIYLLRIFNFPRVLLLSSGILYPFIIIFLDFAINSDLKNKTLTLLKSAALLLIVILCAYFITNNRKSVYEYEYSVASPTTTEFKIAEIEGDYYCYEFVGSVSSPECIKGLKLKNLIKFDYLLNNLIIHEQSLFVIHAKGRIYKLDKDFNSTLFLDIESKVGRIDGTETGLFSLAFHPTNEYFLVNYSDLNNALVVEKFYLKNRSLNNEKKSEIVIKIPNSITGHFGGNIIYSTYFNDFLIAIGDMQIQSDISYLNHESLDTTTPRGKILFINSKTSNTELISENSNTPALKNILATGLRSPWQILENNGVLFVTDVGNFIQEELNLVDLNLYKLNNNKPFHFGWPLYEASIRRDISYEEVLLWENEGEEGKSAFEYIDQNISLPKFFYDHQTSEVYRGAIIGGDIFTFSNDEKNEYFVFMDIFSKEVFLYNFKDDKLLIYPLPQGYNSLPSSIRVNPFLSDSLVISNFDGTVSQITFP